MLDSEFLQSVLLATDTLSRAMPKQMIAVKNLESVHIFCSDYLASLIGIESHQIVGMKTWLPLYHNDEHFEKHIIAEDKKIFESRTPQSLLKINRFTIGITPYLAIKTPIINPDTDNVVGLLFQGVEISLLSLSQSMTNSFLECSKKINYAASPKLSKREKQVIFFFMHNLNSQDIAEMIFKIEGIAITKSTIDSLFNDQLYPKFNTNNRTALYDKLTLLGFNRRIPQELLSATSMMLDPAITY